MKSLLARSQTCSGPAVLPCSCSIRVSSQGAAGVPCSAELPPAPWGGRAAQSTALGFVQEQQSTGWELWHQRSSQSLQFEREKTKGGLSMVRSQGQLCLPSISSQDQKCSVDRCGDKGRHWCFPLWSYPSNALVSSGSAGKGAWATYKLLLLRLEAALQGQERVTFAQSNFGPGSLCVEVAGVGLSSAEAAAWRTNPFACCHKQFSGIAVGLGWKLPWWDSSGLGRALPVLALGALPTGRKGRSHCGGAGRVPGSLWVRGGSLGDLSTVWSPVPSPRVLPRPPMGSPCLHVAVCKSIDPTGSIHVALCHPWDKGIIQALFLGGSKGFWRDAQDCFWCKVAVGAAWCTQNNWFEWARLWLRCFDFDAEEITHSQQGQLAFENRS